MQNIGRTALIGVAALALTAVGSPARAAGSNKIEAVLATPPGITLQALAGGGGGRNEGLSEKDQKKKPVWLAESDVPFFPAAQTRSGGRGTAYADAEGRTLYTYDKDTKVAESNCVDDCAKAWPPALVPAGVKPSGLWSAIKRPDGSKQWAYKDKPLYTYAKDKGVGTRAGDGAAGGTWHYAKFEPTAGIELPYGIALAESLTANGYVLADANRMTIYAADASAVRGKPACALSSCYDRWSPVSAAQLANPIGDFTLISRDDGSKQWAYKGKALYTFSGDEIPGDSNGIGADKKYQIAMVVSYFIPREASMRDDIARGPLVATAEGMTLYRRDTSFHQSNGHGLPKSTPGNQSVGRAMGTKSCDATCLKTWHPFLASASAQPSGYWDIYVRPDGSRQWAYKGFALYSYAGDKRPGDKTGNDIYDVLVADSADHNVYEQGPVNNPTMAAMFWSYVEP